MPVNRSRLLSGVGWLWPVALCILPLSWLMVLRAIYAKTVSVESTVIQCVMVGVVLGVACFGAPLRSADRWLWPLRGIGCSLIGILCALVYAFTGQTIAAWVTASLVCVVCLWFDRVFADGCHWLTRGVIHLLLGAVGAGMISAIAQVESHFSDEEFYVAGLFVGLWIWIALLILAYRFLPHWNHTNVRGLRLNKRWLGAAASLMAIIFMFVAVQQYQSSFFPQSAPQFAGVTSDQPYLCSQTQRDISVYTGSAVSARLLEALAVAQQHSTPDYGLLALSGHEQRWANAFRTSILNEAAQRQFTGPANSIKYGQYEAALRVYYYPRVKVAFPNVFSQDEDENVRKWFAEINRAVYRLDWVDLLYAVAFAQWPSGAYANQDIGAGLVALLESGGFAPQELKSQNMTLIEHVIANQPLRFRNPDDTFNYQVVWLQNQLFLAPFRVSYSPEMYRRSFEWLLLQALPNGSAPSYNHPDTINMAAISQPGATLLNDPRFVWLAGRSLETTAGIVTGDISSNEVRSAMTGVSPDIGSCLIYGDSGLPMQAGPLAPDKIVLRDGWSTDAAYMLINLRFTGWHRYKATNTITLLYQNGTLLNDDTTSLSSMRLPAGRSMVRDKRIPRENLNGLVVGRTGMSRVMYDLTGEGSEWAQDPPYYATVDRFETHVDYNLCQTTIRGWRGWSHTRTIVFYHNGLIIVHDQASGTPETQAILIWNLPGNVQPIAQGYLLQQSPSPSEMRILPMSATAAPFSRYQYDLNSQRGEITVDAQQGKLNTITVFLLRDWVGASTQIIDNDGILNLAVIKDDRKVTYPLISSQP